MLRDQPNECEAVGGIDPDVVEAAGLAHDLGHPPFGHIGEAELNRLLREHTELSFEGNPQSFRILTKLSVRRDESGLNLTRATLNAVLKYPWTRAGEGFKAKKWGAYSSELDEFNFARASHGPGDDRKSAEAELMDWADDIGYAVHDVEDFFRAGLIPLERLRRPGLERDRFLDGAFQRWQDEGILEPGTNIEELRQAGEDLLDAVAFVEPYSGSRRDMALLKTTTASLIARYSGGIKIAGPGDDSVVHIDPQHKMEIKVLKELAWFYVINRPGLATQQYGQRSIIQYLFTAFAGAINSPREWIIFPQRWRDELQNVANGGPDQRLRIVADFISGLSEAQAARLYQRMSGVNFGSALDSYVT